MVREERASLGVDPDAGTAQVDSGRRQHGVENREEEEERGDDQEEADRKAVAGDEARELKGLGLARCVTCCFRHESLSYLGRPVVFRSNQHLPIGFQGPTERE